MSDILSTRKVSDTSVARPQVTGAATAATGTVANLPASLSTASVGALINALVTAQTARGLTTLQTDKGTLVLQTSVPLKAGNEIVLQLQTTGAQNRFLILSVDHQPLSGTQPREASRAGSLTRNPPIAGGNVLGPATNGRGNMAATAPNAIQGTRAETIRGDVNASGQGSANGSLLVRGPLTAGLVVPARVATSTNANVAAGTANVAQGTTSPHTLTAGAILTLRILAVASPGTDPLVPTVPAAQTSGPLQGVVAAATGASGSATGASEIVIPGGKIEIAANPPLPHGSRVLFEILDASGNKSSAVRIPLDPLEFMRIGSSWPALKEAIEVIGSTPANPAMAQMPLTAEPGPRMASTMLFFMAALKSGDVSAWLGDQHGDDLTQSGRSALIGQLAEEFSVMSRHANETQPGTWQALVFPVAGQGHVDLARLYYRRRKNSGDDERQPDATHFVVEADLSRFGMFRLEGLVRPRQFDLAVRSAIELGNNVRDAIRGIFHDALNTGDIGGTIRFETGPTAPFSPPGLNLTSNAHAATLVV